MMDWHRCCTLTFKIWQALKYTTIPDTVTLAHSCCCTILLKPLITDINCLWPSIGSAVADHTLGMHGHCFRKSSICTVSDCISWSQVSQWTPCTKSHAENCITTSVTPPKIVHTNKSWICFIYQLWYLSKCTLYTINLLDSIASSLLNTSSTNF